MNLLPMASGQTQEGDNGGRSSAMVGTKKWAISSNYKYAKAHIWIENMCDTMCGLQDRGFVIVSERGGHEICAICQKNLLVIQNAARR